MSQPQVSVVMVVRNVDRFVAEAIESILTQTFRDFEFLILDFGSTDNSKMIASRYAQADSRIKLHEVPTCGLGEARNAVCSLAQGRYIAVQDADDISLPNRLAVEWEFLQAHPDVAVVGSETQWVDVNGKSLWVHHAPTEDHEIKTALATHCPFVQSSVLVRKDAFVAVGGYRSPFAPAEDYDLWLRVSEHFACANVKDVLLKYRIHTQQVSLRNRRQQSLGFLAAQASAALRRKNEADLLDTVKEITPALLSELGISQAKQQNALFTQYRDWIRNMFIAREYSVALKAASEILQSNWDAVGRPKIADLRLLMARLHWKQGQYLESIFAAGHAAVLQPQIVSDLFESLFQKLGVMRRREEPASSGSAASVP
jgi:Glycosyl transferase family 2